MILQLGDIDDYGSGVGAALPEWFGEAERRHLATLSAERRRRDWMAGRLVAKSAVRRLRRQQGRPAPDWAAIEILPNVDRAPVVARPADAGLFVSLSHRSGRAVAVCSERPGVGVDLERVELRPASFVQDWFDDRERAMIAHPEPLTAARLVTAFWSIKEAALKALGKGLSVPSNSVLVSDIGPDGAVQVRVANALDPRGQGMTVRCWHLPGFVLTWAATGTDRKVPLPPPVARPWIAPLGGVDALVSATPRHLKLVAGR